MHYYQFNIGDYAGHTRHLNPIEDIAYRRLLDLYYLHERPLNAGITSVTRQINMREYEQAVSDVLHEFFVLTDTGWINKRADNEIAHYHAKLEQASKAGKISAAKRAFNVRSTDVQPNNNHKPITINQEPITNNHKPVEPPPTPPRGFEEFWAAYPKKVGKVSAIKIWSKINPPKDKILEALKWQSASDQWNKNNRQFVPNPATYLNQGRWEDEKPDPGDQRLTDIGRRNAEVIDEWVRKKHAEHGL